MKTDNYPLLEFNPKLPRLSASEKAVLKLLVEAGRLIVPIYLEQEKQMKQTSAYFHNEATKQEAVKNIKLDPNILSPYTVLEINNGQVTPKPYHLKYAGFLIPIANKLNQASKITDNKEFGRFLKVQAKALIDGTYEEAAIASLRMKPYILDISIGPIEHHDDRLFHAKASYQAWVGVVNPDSTREFNNYKDIVLSSQRKALITQELIKNDHQVKGKIIDLLLLSGHLARTRFIGVNLPMNLEWIRKQGTEITLFNQIGLLRLKEQIIPTFNRIFSPGFKQGFSEEDLRRGNISYVAMHEMAHNFLYYKNAAKNLLELLAPIYELSASVLGIKMAGSLLLRDAITTKELESMVIAFICRSYYLIERGKTAKEWVNYSIGGSIFINFLTKSGALKEYKGLVILNFTKIFISLQDLLFALEGLLSQGTREDAEIFIEEYH